ncbi:MAG: hypothetical protein V4451_05805 [Pseudomonadota bacterium]
MAKKPAPATEIAKVSNVAKFEVTEAALTLAARFGLNLSDAKDIRVDRAAQNMNRSLHCMVAAGLDLASLQADCEHGEFLTLIEERGFEQSGAYRAISYTNFLLSRSEDERERLLEMPKSKVLALASADSAVIDDLLAEGEDGDLATLSVRELRNRIKELEANNTDLSVQVGKTEAERDGALKKLKRRQRDEEDGEGVPVVVADIRLEIAALVKKAELSVQSMHPVAVEAYNLRGDEKAHDWADPTLRFALAGLVALREQIDGGIKGLTDALGDKAKRLAGQPDALAFLDESEIKAVAGEWATLTATHTHEEALRKHERDQAKPKGRGRPAAAPEAPKAAKA